jgi:hypothetical protein
VFAALGDQPIGDRLYDFWENAFAAWIGTVTSRPHAAPASKGDQSRAAMQRTLERKVAAGELS